MGVMKGVKEHVYADTSNTSNGQFGQETSNFKQGIYGLPVRNLNGDVKLQVWSSGENHVDSGIKKVKRKKCFKKEEVVDTFLRRWE